VPGGIPGLEPWVRQTLYDANRKLPPAVRAALKTGDITPWAPFVDLAPAPPGNQQTAEFRIVGGPTPTSPPLFQINKTSYDPNVINIQRQVNTTDEWLLTSQVEPHIFHIHVNPFEVVDVTTTDSSGNQVSIFDAHGNCKEEFVNPDKKTDKQGLVNQYCGMYHTFRDTIFVENGFTVHMRTHYERYIGEFVIHCHILDHEDAGMMLNIEIVPDLSAPGHGIGMGAMRDSR
jgi:FtsP/CotA-like multicopper oxidase with cupredoxin domain